MFRKLYLLLVFLVSCLACGPQGDSKTPKSPAPAHVIMHGDTDFDDGERKAIQEAADIWKKQTGGLAQITVVWDLDFNSDASLKLLQSESKVIKADSEMDSVKEMDCEAAKSIGIPCLGLRIVLAWVSPGGGIHNYDDVNPNMVVIADRMPTFKFLTQVVVHEMGHVLGIPHINDHKAVMYPTSSPKDGPVCLTEKDLSGYCMANGCGDVEMHPCEGESDED